MLFQSFSHQRQLVVFHWSLSDSKSPQVSRTLLSILAVFNNANYYYYYYYLLQESFSHQCELMVFHWSLSDSKSPQVSRTLLSILTVLNNVVVWMVSSRPLIFKSTSPFNNPFMTELKAPIKIGIIVTFMFHGFFSIPQQDPVTYPLLLLLLLLSLLLLLLLLLLFYPFECFLLQRQLMVFHWSLSDCKSPGLFSVFWSIFKILQF